MEPLVEPEDGESGIGLSKHRWAVSIQQRTSRLLAGLALALAILACSGCTSPNSPPETPTINAPADMVFTGETVNLAAFSVDPDGDTLEFFWSARAGAFSDPFARSTTWTAPANEGSYDITIEVSDGRVRIGNSLSIEVVAREPGVFLPGTRFPETGSDSHIHFKEKVKVTPPVDDISVRSVPEEEIQSQLSRLPGDVTKVIITLEVKPDGLTFAPPAELNFYLAGQGYTAGDVLDVLQYDEQSAEWLPVGIAVVDADGEFAVGNISHTTLFALVERIVTVTPTPTWTPTVPVIAPPPTPCFVAPPPGWQLYTVQRGDTLFSLARRTGTTVATIQQVNCLPGDRIDAGQQIWLPSIPRPATPTATQTPTPDNRPRATFTWTPTPTSTPTATSTWTPTPCPRLGGLTLSVTVVPDTRTVSWNSTGGCPPFTGTLTAQYEDESIAYDTHEVTTQSGTHIDEPPVRCEGTFTIVYTLTLYDSSGQVATTTTTSEIVWIC